MSMNVTRAYIDSLRKSVDAQKQENDKFKSAMVSDEAALERANRALKAAQGEASDAVKFQRDAQTAVESIDSLKDFFSEQKKEVEKSKKLAEESSQSIYASTQIMAEVQKLVEKSHNEATNFNQTNQNSDTPSYQDSFLEGFDQTRNAGTKALTSLSSAALSSFKALDNAEQTAYMANYLQAGLDTASEEAKMIHDNAEKRRQRAETTLNQAKEAFKEATKRANSATSNYENSSFRLNLLKAEYAAAQAGAIPAPPSEEGAA